MNTSFEKKLATKLPLIANKKIILAFSGGKDSSALFHFLNKNKKEVPFSLYACHVNHNLRGDCHKDEKFVRNICRASDVGVEVVYVDAAKASVENNLSKEHEARNLRINSLETLKKKLNCDYILTAHHQDDQLENFFIKTFSGTAIYNLKGFNYRGDVFLRLMLEVSSAEIDEYINFYNVDFIEDSSNSDISILRNWVRRDLIPTIKDYNPAYPKNILKLQEESSELNEYLQYRTEYVKINKNKGCYKINLDKITDLHVYERKYVISSIIADFCRPDKKLIDNILTVMYKEHSRRINLPNEYIFEKSYDNIYFFPEQHVSEYCYIKKRAEKVVILSNLGKVVVFDSNLENDLIVIRNRRRGDRIKGKKLKDLLINAKVDLYQRDSGVVCEKDGEIIFVENLIPNKNIHVKEN